MCFILIGATMCEICEFNLFVGRIRSTSLIIFSLFTVLYTIGVIIHERSRIENQWPFLRHVHALGADDSSINVTVPATWQYSIALCILSALFKIGRLLIQHYFGDKKFFIDDDRQNWQKVSSDEDPHSTIPRASGSGILNETRYSKIETD
uniref:Uncharacterized protein n=1 Tax=Caenorhabditis japonica TaxID=281687 RepID=A0A8R1HLS5_CAEJA